MRLIAGMLMVATLAAQHAAGARLTVRGGEIAYDVAGNGPAVVLLHGAFMDRRTWDRQMPALAKSYRVVRYDMRPFGESSKPEKPYRTTDDLLQLLDHLKIAKAYLIGHSLGGQVAMDFALTYQDRVAGLVMAGAAPSGTVPPAEEGKAIAAVFAAAREGDEALLKAWLNHPLWAVARTRPDLLAELEASTRRNLSLFKMPFQPFLPMDPPAINRLREIKVPTLIVVGDRDVPSLHESARMMAKTLPQATLQFVPGADHALPMGWADDFNRIVLEFLIRH